MYPYIFFKLGTYYFNNKLTQSNTICQGIPELISLRLVIRVDIWTLAISILNPHVLPHHITGLPGIRSRCAGAQYAKIIQNQPVCLNTKSYSRFFFFIFHRINCFPHDHCFCRLEVHGHWQHVMPRASFRKTLGCRIYRTKERVAANTHLGSLFRQCKMDCFSFFECLQLCFYFLMCNFRFKRNSLVLDQPRPSGFGIQTIGCLPASRWNGKNIGFPWLCQIRVCHSERPCVESLQLEFVTEVWTLELRNCVMNLWRHRRNKRINPGPTSFPKCVVLQTNLINSHVCQFE